MKAADIIKAVFPKDPCVQSIVVSRPVEYLEPSMCKNLLSAWRKKFGLSPATNELALSYIENPSKEGAEALLRSSPEMLYLIQHEFGYMELVEVMKRIVADPKISAGYIRRLLKFNPKCVEPSAMEFIEQFGSAKAKKYAVQEMEKLETGVGEEN